MGKRNATMSPASPFDTTKLFAAFDENLPDDPIACREELLKKKNPFLAEKCKSLNLKAGTKAEMVDRIISVMFPREDEALAATSILNQNAKKRKEMFTKISEVKQDLLDEVADEVLETQPSSTLSEPEPVTTSLAPSQMESNSNNNNGLPVVPTAPVQPQFPPVPRNFHSLSPEDIASLCTLNDWGGFLSNIALTHKFMEKSTQAWIQAMSCIIKCATETQQRRNSPVKPLKSIPILSPAAMEQIALETGTDVEQVRNVFQLTKSGNMMQFIGHCCRIFGLDAIKGGIHKADGVEPWNPLVLASCKTFITRITSGAVSLTDAQKEIVSWARYERYKIKNVTPTSVYVESTDDEK